MNVPLMIGLMAVFFFAIGILVGSGLNGREQIARDKRHAATRRELNDRLRELSAVPHAVRIPAQQARRMDNLQRSA